MSRGTRSLVRVLISSALFAAASAGCRERTYAPVADGGNGSTDAPPPLTLDIAITGCDTYDPINAHCSGTAPLALNFSPVGSPQFSRFTWTFDDGSPLVTDRAPMHEFVLPRSYEVDLVGAFGVANTVMGSITVKVAALAAGEPCDFDLQCGTGLRCACAPGAGCDPAFQRGLCSTPCDGAACGANAVCAALALALAPLADGGPPASAPWCVKGCPTGTECAPGFVCEVLAGMAGASPGPWTRGCVPIGALGDVGANCRDANGQLADATCATGHCIDLGALGSCSAACDDARGCPPGTTCAVMADGRQLCLVGCGPGGTACARDPLLACTAPTIGGAGATGFRADGGAGATYCAPKPCSGDTDCAPAGLCGAGAQCVRSGP